MARAVRGRTRPDPHCPGNHGNTSRAHRQHLRPRTRGKARDRHQRQHGGRRHPLFRDWLRDSGPQNLADREAYGELKLSLSGRTWEDMAVYNDRKGPLIAEIMTRAEKWAEATGWHLCPRP
ncbi:MAG TPA: GrpB family protein [Candidatus Corynebacterium faecigallinarum]|uniref:GrpB family protein n=1 Tax=Candidatus Corynebacterium faecigallinarum TaxID=2838528 RepID=A0A9D2QIX3_9CORY|nr:GrpB family protein [Candidatus Corynebacterium faecigallinarum]